MASLCPSRPSYGGKPGESSKPWVRRIQLQQGGGELGGQASCCPVVGRQRLSQPQREDEKQAVHFALCGEQSVCLGNRGRI